MPSWGFSLYPPSPGTTADDGLVHLHPVIPFPPESREQGRVDVQDGPGVRRTELLWEELQVPGQEHILHARSPELGERRHGQQSTPEQRVSRGPGK